MFARRGSLPITTPAGSFAELVLLNGSEQQVFRLDHTPFTIGRRAKDLLIRKDFVSREHAEIRAEGPDYVLVDVGSTHGTYVNGKVVKRHKLNHNDRIEFGARGGPSVIFSSTKVPSTAREFLSQLSGVEVRSTASILEKLTFLLEATRKLNATGVVDEILVTLIESTLRLTGAERGYVFLRDPRDHLRLAAGRNAKGEPLLDDTQLSHSIIDEAARSASTFVITDTAKAVDLATRQSVVKFDLRTVICIPLRKPQVKEKAAEATPLAHPETNGVLYLDSHYASRDMSRVSKDILNAIATEAASLVENARLMQAEEAARRYQQELNIAASIQQRLMAVTIPELSFASIQASNLPCRDVGGDLFDVIPTSQGVAVVVADVCGKGISAALLASILQGMTHAQLCVDVPLAEIVSSANRFLCQKSLGEKYATMVIAHLKANGEMDFVNCGHVRPLLVSDSSVTRIEESNLPVGIFPEASYETGRCMLTPGDHVVVVTDGVTEAEDPSGEFFGNDRLETAAAASLPFQEIFNSVRAFCAGASLADDCTVVELTYLG
jgi:sigma-B regulation protein RsbU (phosphoserine phosphatase)